MEELFQAVYDCPDDDAPRHALASALGSDPRGEFIRLQLDAQQSADARKQQKRLQRAHGASWLAPLQRALVASTVRWARGFPVAGRLAFQKKPNDSEALVGLSPLATLRELDVSGGNVVHSADWLHRFLFATPLRGLRSLHGAYARDFTDFLTSTPPWKLQQLHFVTPGGARGRDAQAAEVLGLHPIIDKQVGLPAVADLSLSYPFDVDPVGNYRWLWDTTFGQQLRVLTMNHSPAGILPWVDALTRDSETLGLERVVFFASGKFELVRTPEGWTLLRGDFPDSAPKHLHGTLNRAIEEIRAKFPLEVEISGLD